MESMRAYMKSKILTNFFLCFQSLAEHNSNGNKSNNTSGDFCDLSQENTCKNYNSETPDEDEVFATCKVVM